MATNDNFYTYLIMGDSDNEVLTESDDSQEAIEDARAQVNDALDENENDDSSVEVAVYKLVKVLRGVRKTTIITTSVK